MTAEQEEKLNQLGKSVADIQGQLVDIQSRKSDVQVVGRPVNTTISISDLEATLRVLQNLKSIGYQSIDLS